MGLISRLEPLGAATKSGGEAFHDAGVHSVLDLGSAEACDEKLSRIPVPVRCTRFQEYDLEFDILLWYFRPFPVHVGWRPRLSRVHVAGFWGACVMGAFSRGAYLLTVFKLVVAPPGAHGSAG